MSPLDDTKDAAIDTSVVMATCGRAAMLREALRTVIDRAVESGLAVELVVVDDGSADETPEVLGELARSCPFPMTVLGGERRGVAAARNLAARHAQGAWLASFDDDQLALPGWLRELRAAADASGAGCVGGALELKLPAGWTVDALGPRARRILGEHRDEYAGAGDGPRPYRSGVRPATNNALLRRDVFLELGGFDTSFTEGAEDADFFRRAAEAGHAPWYAPAARALHVIPARRLERASLRWTSLRIGASDARLQQSRRRLMGPLRLAAVRCGIALLRDLPQMGSAKLRGDRRGLLDAECSLWYTEGLLRALPAILGGRERRSEFLQTLDFRSRNGERAERTVRSDAGRS